MGKRIQGIHPFIYPKRGTRQSARPSGGDNEFSKEKRNYSLNITLDRSTVHGVRAVSILEERTVTEPNWKVEYHKLMCYVS